MTAEYVTLRAVVRHPARAAYGVALVLPLFLPIRGFESVPPLAQGAALLSVVFLPMALGEDLGRRMPGGGLRVSLYLFALAGAIAYVAGTMIYGASLSSSASALNWVALAGIVLGAQRLLSSLPLLRFTLNVWVISYALLAALAVILLVGHFGTQILTSTNRGPFQAALRNVLPSWPNYFGVALAVSLVIVYARILAGAREASSIVLLSVLSVGILATFSRAAIAAAGVGLIAMAVTAGRLRRVNPVFFLSFLMLVLLATQLPGVRYQFVATLTPGTSQNIGLIERLAYAAEAVRIWKVHPTIGIGFHQFVEFASPFRIAGSGGTGAVLGSVHNEFVTTLLKSGALGLGTLLLVLFCAFRLFRRAARSASVGVRSAGLAGVGIVTVLTVAGMTLESLRSIILSAPFWVLLGSLSGLDAHSPTAREPLIGSQGKAPC